MNLFHFNYQLSANGKGGDELLQRLTEQWDDSTTEFSA
jgi:hypothetical protein